MLAEFQLHYTTHIIALSQICAGKFIESPKRQKVKSLINFFKINLQEHYMYQSVTWVEIRPDKTWSGSKLSANDKKK